MSGIGSAIGAALGGLGAGVASLANRYINEEMEQQRAQALADIQFANMQRTEQWQQSDEVQGQRLVNQRKALEMQSDVSLKGKVAEATNPELRQAGIDTRVQYLEGTTPAEIKAKNEIIAGTSDAELEREKKRRAALDPMDIEKHGAIARAEWGARSDFDDRLTAKKSPFDRMPEADRRKHDSLSRSQEKLQELLDKASLEGGGLKDKDGNVRPEVEELQRRIGAHELAKKKIEAKNGVIDGGQEALAVVYGEKNPAKIRKAIQEATLIGPQFARDFAVVANDYLAQLEDPSRSDPGGSEPQKLAAIRKAMIANGDAQANVQIGGKGQMSVDAQGNVTASSQAQKPVSLFDQAARWLSTTRGQAQQQGMEYQELQRRAAEARRGGAPLSRQEAALARQYGIDTGVN